MRKAWIAITVLLFAGLFRAEAQDAREAVAKAIHSWSAVGTITRDQIELPVVPKCDASISDWKIQRARFDPTLRSWVVEMNCAASKVPFVAVVHVGDPKWSGKRPEHMHSAPVMVRAGEVRSITLQVSGIRITEQVVCLRSARIGEVIRVRSLDRKVMRRAVVSDSGKLVLAGQ
jgi:hypothetical protein